MDKNQTTKAGARTQHTPGPWSHSKYNHMLIIPDPTGKSVSGEIDESELCHGGSSLEEAQANVCLIAAAPELYELLKIAKRAARGLGSVWQAKAKAAINKAEGVTLWADIYDIKSEQPARGGYCDDCGDTAVLLHEGQWKCGSCGANAVPNKDE